MLTFFKLYRVYFLAAFAAVALGASFVVGKRWEAANCADERIKLVNDKIEEVRRMYDAGVKAMARQAAVIADANKKVADLQKKRAKDRQTYEEALRADPDCKAWAEQAIRCPVSWR